MWHITQPLSGCSLTRTMRLFVWTWTVQWPGLSPSFIWQLALLSYNHSLFNLYCKPLPEILPHHPATKHLLAPSCKQSWLRCTVKAPLRASLLLQIGLVLLHDGIACYATDPRPHTGSIGKSVICWREGLVAVNSEGDVYLYEELVKLGKRWWQHSDDALINDDISHIQIKEELCLFWWTIVSQESVGCCTAHVGMVSVLLFYF